MERELRTQLIRGCLIYATLFVSLFISHIIFAANNYDLAFKIVAGLITILTFIVGISLIYFGKINSQRVKINRIGGAISIFLACGLGWAYAGMRMHWNILLWPIATIFSHWIIERMFLIQHHDLK
jgi:hypothetical protein